MTFADYRAAPGVNISYLKGFARSPAHALVKKEATPAMALGTAFHTLILQPERFDQDVMIYDAAKTVTKDHMAKYPDKAVISRANMEALECMALAVSRHPQAREALSCGPVEQSLFWELDGVACKGRPDVYAPDVDLIVDLKKTKDASFLAFRKQMESLLYHWQGAFYLDAHKVKTGREGRFCFVCVEDTPPYGVACYNLMPRHVELGRQGYQKAVQSHLECLKTGVYPAYPEGWIDLTPSKWASDGFTNYELEGDDFDE